MTALAVNLGEKPAVPSAIAKYHVTELGRHVCLAAMDLHAGKAVMTGPKNCRPTIRRVEPMSGSVSVLSLQGPHQHEQTTAHEDSHMVRAGALVSGH